MIIPTYPLVTKIKRLIKAFLGLSVVFLVGWGITLHKQNKKLSESLEMAQNNIEANQGSIAGSQQANNVLRLDIASLQQQNDKLLHDIDSVSKKLKIKSKQINTAATQTQSINVNKSKGVRGDIQTILYKDSIYKDSISYNDLTTVYYTIGKDTVNVALDIQNTQYLFVYSTKEYKNKKSFLKRLFTLDFKKVHRDTYRIQNTNELLRTSDVRVVKTTSK